MDGEWSWSGHAAGRSRVVQSPGAWAPRPAGFHGACTAPPPTELQVVRVPGSEGVQEEMVQRSGASCPDPVCVLVVCWPTPKGWLSVAGRSPDWPRLPISLV